VKFSSFPHQLLQQILEQNFLDLITPQISLDTGLQLKSILIIWGDLIAILIIVDGLNLGMKVPMRKGGNYSFTEVMMDIHGMVLVLQPLM
jgi:hypothetical protein